MKKPTTNESLVYISGGNLVPKKGTILSVGEEKMLVTKVKKQPSLYICTVVPGIMKGGKL